MAKNHVPVDPTRSTLPADIIGNAESYRYELSGIGERIGHISI